jgi:CRISPR-associated protein Cas1
MRRHLNTIYVTSENAWVRKDGENLVIDVEGQELGRAPLHCPPSAPLRQNWHLE